MRIGQNPAKEIQKLADYHQHRIIIPVYIPELSGYFEHSLEILDLCLQSLHFTTTEKDSITLISNGCTSQVTDALFAYQARGWIDQVIINHHNHGKIDTILSAARGSYEDIITFADCDAFFYPGWFKAVCQVFNAFPEAGWVSSMPAPDTTRLNTASTIFMAFFKGVLKKKPVEAENDLNRFGESIGRPEMYRSRLNEHYLAVERNDNLAIVGGGHFSFSIRRQVLQDIPATASAKFMAEEEFLGQPFDRAGYWRLSTPRLYVQHMGNTPEKWMFEDIEQIKTSSLEPIDLPATPGLKPIGFFPYSLRTFFLKLAKNDHFLRCIPDWKSAR